jgi:hypothetical protein
VERLRLQEERARRVAEERAQIDARKAARIAQKRDRDAQKSTRLPKQAKSKTSHQSQSKITKRRGDASARRPQVVHKRSLTLLLCQSHSGCIITATEKLR